MKPSILVVAVIAMCLLHACKPKESASAPDTVADSALEGYFSSEDLPDAQSIHVARVTAKPGDQITLKGEVIGREKVFVDGRAAFLLGDPEKLTSCDKKPGDACATPWDACCDSNEVKQSAIASIQILDRNGRVYPEGIRGVRGLRELSSITVRGVVDQASTADNFIINALQIHVRQK